LYFSFVFFIGYNGAHQRRGSAASAWMPLILVMALPSNEPVHK